MLKNIRHTGIVVNDLKASMHFYADLLGFKVAKKMEETGHFIENILKIQGVKVTTVKLALSNGQMVELLHFHTHAGTRYDKRLFDIGPTHIAMTVDDLDKMYEMLRDNGVRFNSPPQISPDGFAKVAFCCAPEGTFIELVEVMQNA